jgi:hypothetical protein
MGAGDGGDDFVVFEGVRIVRATASDLCCRVAGRSVWLPRRHVRGELRARGDRGALSIRRWIAHDRALIARSGEAPRALRPSGRPSGARLDVRLHLVGSA